jgi:glycosyltransferase involved in cell wall biosynthesis
VLEQITPLILTLNEEANIARVVERLGWAREVVVVDSGSTDATRRVLAGFGNVRCVEHAFEGHADQWNFGLGETGIATEWVLALDADYVVSEELVAELRDLVPAPGTVGYRVGFRYCTLGKVLRGTLYPPVVALYRRNGARYVQDGHTQRVQVNGRIEALRGVVLHDDRKPLPRWLAAQVRYAQLEADLLSAKTWRELRWPDRLRKLPFVMPPLAFAYCLVATGGILDGWPGIYYAGQRAMAEAILSLVLVERKVAAAGRRGAKRA